MAPLAAIFWAAPPLHRLLGENGARVVRKLAHLLLAALGGMIVRRGLELLLR